MYAYTDYVHKCYTSAILDKTALLESQELTVATWAQYILNVYFFDHLGFFSSVIQLHLNFARYQIERSTFHFHFPFPFPLFSWLAYPIEYNIILNEH